MADSNLIKKIYQKYNSGKQGEMNSKFQNAVLKAMYDPSIKTMSDADRLINKLMGNAQRYRKRKYDRPLTKSEWENR